MLTLSPPPNRKRLSLHGVVTHGALRLPAAGSVLISHDVTERLSWELQAPLTVRPQDFEAFQAKTNWQVERDKMKKVCMQCHGKTWVDDHYVKLDKVVSEYNEVYFKPAKKCQTIFTPKAFWTVPGSSMSG